MPAPPEAEAIRLARMAARLSVDDAVAKVRAAGGQISATYWRDIERGHGGRRGVRVPARVSDGLLAQMADAVGVTPDQLQQAAKDHPDGEGRARVVRQAARVLEEIQRREETQPPAPAGFPVLRPDAANLDEYFPAIPSDLAGDFPAYLAVVEQQYRDAQRRHQTERPTGIQIFPADTSEALTWDNLSAADLNDAQRAYTIAWRRLILAGVLRESRPGRSATGLAVL